MLFTSESQQTYKPPARLCLFLSPVYRPPSTKCGFKYFFNLGRMGYGEGGTPNMENEIYELHAERHALSTAIKSQLKLDGRVY